jgi:hypothetical protein
MLKHFQNKPIFYDSRKIMEWLVGRKNQSGVFSELNTILAEGMTQHPMNKAKVHAKLESLVKEDLWDQPLTLQKIRIIVWHAKGICAIFAPIFLEAKNRLKALLNERTIYADGLTPDELSARLRLVGDNHYFLETDLAKQDRQTDKDLIDIEMYTYRQLGVDPRVISLWRVTHEKWRFKGVHVSGILDWMRWTGQATTSIGNVITNMAVNSRILDLNLSAITLVLQLGDDFAALLTRKINVAEMKKISKQFYNMDSKASISEETCTFLQMNIYKNAQGVCEVGPDYRRLRKRFEVTNGTTNYDSDVFLSRVMAYIMMLGSTKEVLEVVKMYDLPLEPKLWYEMPAAIHASAIRHDTSELEVLNDYNLLINMMKTQRLYQHTWTHLKDDQ